MSEKKPSFIKCYADEGCYMAALADGAEGATWYHGLELRMKFN